MMRVDESTIRRGAREGKYPYTRLFGDYRFDREEIEKLIRRDIKKNTEDTHAA